MKFVGYQTSIKLQMLLREGTSKHLNIILIFNFSDIKHGNKIKI